MPEKFIRRPPCGPLVAVAPPIPDGSSVGQVPVWNGTLYVPGLPIGIQQSVVGANWSAPVILALLPANHPPGLYALKLDIINRVSPTTGTLTKRLDYSAPLFGATFDTRPGVLITGAGHVNANAFAMICVSSDGVNPIMLTLTPAGITGSPVVDIYAALV